jgi:hypothetical protein
MKEWLRQLFTHSDNKTHDIARYLAALSSVHFLFLAGFDVIVHGHPFDMQGFGIGIGATFTGLGAWMGFRGERHDANPN